jgi:hypothetical protein
MSKSKSTSKRMGKAHSQQRVVRLVLAGNHHQADRYARQMGWQPNEWRYLASDAYARGYRDVELHKVGTWYERQDAGEIMRVLEPTRQIGTLKIIAPNAEISDGTPKT